jgi:hypothetical protein
MMQIDLETGFGSNEAGKLPEAGCVDLEDLLTAATHEVNVWAMLVSRIDDGAVVERGARGKPLAHKKIQRPINSSEIDGARAGMHRTKHLFGSDVIAAMRDCIKDHFALRRDAVPPLAQNVSKCICHNLLLQLFAIAESIRRSPAAVKWDAQRAEDQHPQC